MKDLIITHTVIKNEDIEKTLDTVEKTALREIIDRINVRRIMLMKPENQYIVINTDEPYIEEIIAVLKAHGHWGGKK